LETEKSNDLIELQKQKRHQKERLICHWH